jgi:hypothetical protein
MAENAELKRQLAIAGLRTPPPPPPSSKTSTKSSQTNMKKENEGLKKELELLKLRLSGPPPKSPKTASSASSPASSRSSDTGSDQQDVKSLNIDRSSPDGQEFDLDSTSTTSSSSCKGAAVAEAAAVTTAEGSLSDDEVSPVLKALRREIDELKKKLSGKEAEAEPEMKTREVLDSDLTAKCKDLEESLDLMRGEFENMEDYWQVRSIRVCLGGDPPISKWRIHLLKGLVQTAVSANLQRFGE